MNYQQKLDDIFGNGKLWKHRTMRTVFDPYSAEYNQTSIKKKLEIVKIITSNNIEITDLIREYKTFYRKENKQNVIDSLEEGILILFSNLLSEE